MTKKNKEIYQNKKSEVIYGTFPAGNIENRLIPRNCKLDLAGKRHCINSH